MIKKLFFSFITFLMFESLKAENLKDTIIYVGDPMCSWCYGFSPELDKIKAAFPNTHFLMVMGGLRINGDESMEDLSSFLWEHWKDVQKASGQKFNFSILKNSNFFYDTEPACRAVVLVRNLFPDMEYKFFKALQHAFYFDNYDPTEIETFNKVLADLKLDDTQFNKLFKKTDSRDNVIIDFQNAQSLGVKGFPALFARINGKLYSVTNGYQKADKLINLLKDKGMK
jgi:putative protein-disulfide isomerase